MRWAGYLLLIVGVFLILTLTKEWGLCNKPLLQISTIANKIFIAFWSSAGPLLANDGTNYILCFANYHRGLEN